MNIRQDNGFSFIEALLAVTLLFFIAAFLLPQFSELKQAALAQKLEMHASEVAFNGARKVRDYGETRGFIDINQRRFYWQYEGGEICVTYEFEGEVHERCVSK